MKIERKTKRRQRKMTDENKFHFPKVCFRINFMTNQFFELF